MKRVTAGFGLLAVLFMFLLVLEPLPVYAAASLVQQNSAFCFDTGGPSPCSGTTLSASFSSNIASGNLLVLAISVANVPATTVSTISDTRSSSFSQVILSHNTYSYEYIYYASLTSSGPDTVMVTFSASLQTLNSYAYIHIYEVSGGTPTGIATGPGSGTIGGGSSGAVSTSSTAFQSGAFLVAIASEDCLTGTWSAGSGFTLSPNPPFDQFIDLSMSEYAISGVPTPTTFPATLGPSSGGCNQNWVEAGVAFNLTLTPPIPEYPLGLPILAILTILSYAVIKHRTRK